MKTFAIGDVHGCREQLEHLLSLIMLRFNFGDKIVFVGDYVDRGPDSKGVIDTIMKLQDMFPGDVTCCMGNHEDMMISALADERDAHMWLSNGGYQTLKSFGVTDVQDIPIQYINWIKALNLWHEDEFRFYVHAGIDCWTPLEDQKKDWRTFRSTFLWVRHQFLSSRTVWDKLVVHGHTVTSYDRSVGGATLQRPNILASRVNVDCGSVFGGSLAAAVFDSQWRAPIDTIVVSGLKREEEDYPIITKKE